MELEEMKTAWQEMTAQMDKQKKLTDTLIIKMTQLHYRNKINKIAIPEIIGSLVCLAFLVFILLNIQQLNTPWLLAAGIITAIILLVLPVGSLRTVSKMRRLNISGNSYKQSLLDYSKAKKQFIAFQKFSFYVSAILMVTCLPVLCKLMAGPDLFKQSKLWLGYAISFPFLYLFATWVFKCYSKAAAGAENILKELEN